MISFQFKLSSGKPAGLDEAGQAWREAATNVEKGAKKALELAKGISGEDWTAQDRPAYEKKVQEFSSQLEVLQTYCQAVGVSLTTLAYALATYAVFAMGMAVFLDGLAVAMLAAIAAEATVVGAPAATAAIASMVSACLTAQTVTCVATGILAAAGNIAGVVIGGGTLLSAMVEKSRGNDKAMRDFINAQKTGAAGAAANLTQNAANAGLAWINRFDPSGYVPTGHKGSPLKEIDLDADRGIDNTWNLGAGAKVQVNPQTGEHEFGVRGKYGDHGFQGIEGEYGHKRDLGGSGFQGAGGAKFGWQEDSDGKGGDFYGGGKVGIEHPTTGSKGTAEGQIDDDGETKGKLEGNTAGGSQKVEKKKDENPPWDSDGN